MKPISTESCLNTKDNTFYLEDFLLDLEKLINIDSGRGAAEGATRVGLMLAEPLVKRGWIIERHNLSPNIGECIVVKNRQAERFDALLLGHVDTVFPAGESAECPFYRDEERAYGPGVYDMKQGCLAVVHSLLAMSPQTNEALNIAVIFNTDEEISSVYSTPLIKSYAERSEYAFVFEPSMENGGRCIERKGILRSTFQFEGKACHSALMLTDDGRSAIAEMGYWIAALSELNSKETGTSVNPGIVKGGKAANIVADFAELTIDVRIKTLEEQDKVLAVLDSLAEHARSVGIIVTEVDRRTRPPWMPDERTKRYAEHLRKLSLSMGIPFEIRVGWGASDGNTAANCGAITIDDLGPGGDHAHTADEYMLLADVEPNVRFFHAVLEDLAQLKAAQ
ncbi:MAG: M20 family metallopeptidase [Clostridiaceae bacterium]|nr:M20 family metallopeptidase [Clostridiaceae bacterium]